MKDPLDGDRTTDMFDPIIPGEAGATAESEVEKRRAKWREKKRKQRDGERKQKQALATEDESEWFERNRALLSQTEWAAMVVTDAYVRDVLHSMKTVQSQDDELVQIVTDLVREYGTLHIDAFRRDLGIPADWSERSYWQDPVLLRKLEAENEQTAQFVRYGMLTALPADRVYQLLITNGWTHPQVLKMLGMVEGRDGVKFP